MQKRILALLCAVSLLLLSSCSGKEVKTAEMPKEVANLATSVVAQDGDYLLKWNNERKYISYENTKTGDVWAGIPTQFLNSDVKFNRLLDAPLNITAFNPKDRSTTKISGYSYAISSGRVGAEKVENGVKVTYCFDKFGICVPVTYSLNKGMLDVKINTSEIVETTYQIVSLELTPNLCSVKNGTKDSEIFIPAGSGALLDCSDTVEIDRKFSEYVYGVDASRILLDNWYTEEKITMPVFGIKNGNTALYGIIKSYDSAKIEAIVNNSQTGYSGIYPTFELRGYDAIENTSGTLTNKYAEDFSRNQTIEVSYFMLGDDGCSYTDAAKVYRDYLKQEYGLKDSANSQKPLLTFYGGDIITDYILGIPKDELFVLTSFDEASAIIKDLKNATSTNFDVQLKGYSKTGLEIGKVAGGFDYASEFGSKKQFAALQNLVKDSKANIYFDFDIVRFNKSGNGFRKLYSAAKTANKQRMKVDPLTIDVHSVDTKDSAYFLVSKVKVSSLVDKLIKKSDKKGISGISLSTYGNIAYSYYTEEQYQSRGKTRTQVADTIKKLQKANHNVLVESAFDYAAATANAVTNVEFTNGEYSVFDKIVPFYQIVFSGSTTLYSNPINASGNTRTAFLDAVATGVIPSFSIIKNYDTQLKINKDYVVSKSLISANKDLIVSYVKEYSTVSSAVKGSKIASYEQLSKDLSKTVFENGTVIYVNYSDAATEVDGITVEQNNFKVVAK